MKYCLCICKEHTSCESLYKEEEEVMDESAEMVLPL